MSTTKPTAPDEDKKYIVRSNLLIEDPIIQEETNKRFNKLYYILQNYPIKQYNFIKSKFGEIRFNTKLSLETAVKEYCIDRCLNYEGVNIHQEEKLCMSNCASEGVNFIEAFYMYKHQDYLNHVNNTYYNIDSSIPVKKI